MRFRLLALIPLLLISACGGDNSTAPAPAPTPGRFAATQPAPLSTGSPTKDEDPTAILAADGSIVVAWFSNRGGNSDIYIARCARGTEWSDPVRVTDNTDTDFYPNLYQDANGTFHLTWYRWDASNQGHIWYNRTTDPLVWDTNSEVQVTTTGSVDDWVPCIAETPDSLRIFFVSQERTGSNTSDIYIATSPMDTVMWDDGRRFVHSLANVHDHLPCAAWTGSRLDVVWVRYDVAQPFPPLASELCYAYSPDGVLWSGEYLVTLDYPAVSHVFPSLYQRSDGSWRILWMTTRTGMPQVVEMPLQLIGYGYPAALIVNDSVSPGYSHRVTRTPVKDLYFGAWVQGPDGEQDIYYRFYQN
ncbi:MAG TPA: hypothetical protein VFH88_14150 [Candidatus Krumholzibacteria bacterium]|nr:hypothetical protein [Candidatus Krumholzibacteria bacterium]